MFQSSYLYRNIAINKYDMGLTKTDGYTDKQNALAIGLKALAHPARIAIVEHILTVNSCICGDIVEALPLSQPTISQHLKELKAAGIIKGTITGNAVCYCLDENGFEVLKSFVEQLEQSFVKQRKCC